MTHSEIHSLLLQATKYGVRKWCDANNLNHKEVSSIRTGKRKMSLSVALALGYGCRDGEYFKLRSN